MLRLLSILALTTCLLPGLRAQTFEETMGLQPSYLTMDEALHKVLEKSLDVRIEWLNWAVADSQTDAAWGKFEPAYFLSSTWRESNLPQNALEYVQTGGVFLPLDEPNMFKQQSFISQTGIEGLLPLGTQYKIFASLGEFRNDLNRQRPPSIFYPEYAAAVGVTLTQPLLRDFGPDVNLAEVRVSRKNEAIADHQWEARLQRSIALVMLDYYDLIFAVENLGVKRDVVIFAQKLVAENQKRLEAGQLSPADVQEAEVAVALAREEVITALSFAVEKQRSIKGQILGSLEEGSGLIFLPRDSLPIISPHTDRERLLRTALARRPDHRAAIEEAEKQAIVVKYSRNQLLPRLDLQATLTANGLSGDRSGAYQQAFDRQGYDTQVGFQFSIPLGNRTAKANSAVAENRQQQAILNIARSELNVSVELDTIIAQVKAAKARLESTRESVGLSERLLETEQKRLGEGVARTFDVLKARSGQADARTRQIAALADYNKAATQLALISGTLLERQGIRIDRSSRQPQAVKDKH
ncbi:outer membrane protein TolC [Prosthecobacter fusiformis]|uniref:Outer membrane protein TolC n=1 Tax=Prosthecobacter fusiformis TaxID=48464 RepID=A0A4R7SRB9_9BACT|nr:TolC family protein [Prosthecobacter fusiformis]TDU81504.1 outer membrane protein TolC [Prosthecobacter fusiformis]